MYQQQQQQEGEGEILTPHESIITQDQDQDQDQDHVDHNQETALPDFAINYHDISALTNPSNNYPHDLLDFHHLQHDVTGSNYFTYHTDSSARLGVGVAPPVDNAMLYHQPDLSYQQLPPNLNALVRDGYRSLPSESSGFVPGMVEGYTNTYMDISGAVQGQFESSRVGAGAGAGAGAGRRQRGGAGGGGAGGKGIEKKEKQRRERLGEKYEMLKVLIPNRTKDDRATIVSDAIDYINELCRTVNELKLLVEKKRIKAGSFCVGNNSTTESSEVLLLPDNIVQYQKEEEALALAAAVPSQGLRLRSSWLQRRSKEALVDVRIIEDEVNIKITKKKKAIGCLLPVSRAIDDLHLHLLNLAGGIIGECHVYMFNTQIMEGSSVYASAVAKKLIEVIDMY